MDFIHTDEYLNRGDVVVVDCDTQCNVMLTDDINFSRFRRGDSCDYRGGFYDRFPVRIAAPQSGRWHITIDVGEGYSANIHYSINVVRC